MPNLLDLIVRIAVSLGVTRFLMARVIATTPFFDFVVRVLCAVVGTIVGLFVASNWRKWAAEIKIRYALLVKR